MKMNYLRMVGGVLFSLPLLFASCGNGDNALEEIINGGGSGGGSSTTENKYYVWDDTQLKLVATDIPSDAKEITTSTEKLEGGTYIVKGDVTISRAEGLDVTADSKLILCDGAKLTVNGHIEDESGSNTLKISIYGQEKQTGQLIINATDSHGLWAKDIEIHGGDIDVKAVTGGFIPNGIYTYNDLAIYGGTVKATGGDADATYPGGYGILCGNDYGPIEGNLTIKGDAVVKAYGGAKNTNSGGDAIHVTKDVEISGNADVYAEAGEDATAAIYCSGTADITIKGKKLEVNCSGAGSGIETTDGSVEISAGTISITHENGIAIQSNKAVNISGCTFTSTGGFGRNIDAGTTVEFANDVVKIELINLNLTGDASAITEYVNAGTSFTCGGSPVNLTGTIGEFVASSDKVSFDGTTKKLTYQP